MIKYMDSEKIRGIIEAILFSAGRTVSLKELELAIEINSKDIMDIINDMNKEYTKADRGIEIIRVNNGFQMCSKKEYYEYIYQVIDKRVKPKLSQSAMETLAIIAYNPKITRAEIETIRGVASDSIVYKLLEYNLIEEAGKLDILGKPMSYKTTDEFLKTFGLSSLDELPELPKYKIDENQQIVIDDLVKNEMKVTTQQSDKSM